MASDLMRIVWLTVTILNAIEYVHSTEQGKWTRELKLNKLDTDSLSFYKTLYNQSSISVTIICNGEKPMSKLYVNWLLRWSPCAGEYLGLDGSEEAEIRVEAYFRSPQAQQIQGYNYEFTEIMRSEEKALDCSNHKIELKLNKDMKRLQMLSIATAPTSTVQPADPGKPGGKEVPSGNRRRRESGKATTTAKVTTAKVTTAKVTTAKVTTAKVPTTVKVTPSKTGQPAKTPEQSRDPTEGKDKEHVVCNTWRDGVFLFILQLGVMNDSKEEEAQITCTVEMKNDSGYLSSMEWPLLIFYGVMCIVYVLLGLIWLVLLACNWRDLLRVQFWIGGVIVLGMLEKAVFYAEFQNINHKGESVPGANVFAELVSCFKRTVARMLVIIVSLGFGIVKPRLGPMLHKVLGVGSLYFIFAAVEGCFRTIKSKYDMSKTLFFVTIPLVVIDASICWWIFTSLVQTLRTLRLRRNIVKLSLYRHFTNTLVFAVLASIAFMVWSYTQHKLKICLKDWKELWVDDAYWHLLFSVILIVIMILWRPTVNNQRYAFSPLLDAAEDEADEDVIMSDAFEGMKMRGTRNGSPRQSAASKAEDDLKWVEENIPSTIIDKAIPGIIDSDEEIVTTKLEMAKMD